MESKLEKLFADQNSGTKSNQSISQRRDQWFVLRCKNLWSAIESSSQVLTASSSNLEGWASVAHQFPFLGQIPISSWQMQDSQDHFVVLLEVDTWKLLAELPQWHRTHKSSSQYCHFPPATECWASFQIPELHDLEQNNFVLLRDRQEQFRAACSGEEMSTSPCSAKSSIHQNLIKVGMMAERGRSLGI